MKSKYYDRLSARSSASESPQVPSWMVIRKDKKFCVRIELTDYLFEHWSSVSDFLLSNGIV